MKILVALAFVQVISKISCSPTTYVIESYSNVRLQQPTMGLSVESQMPIDIMMNPILADEPPTQVDKMESIFMKSDQIKSVKSMNIDEKEIMESINKQNHPIEKNDSEDVGKYDERDFIAIGNEQRVGFKAPSEVVKAEK